MIYYEKEFGKQEHALGVRQTQIATTFKVVYGWMCAGLALSGVIAWYTAASGLWQTVLGILVFTGLTMYDAQKVKQLAAAEGNMDSAAIRRVGILGALTLYLDFINLFLHILRFLGRKR